MKSFQKIVFVVALFLIASAFFNELAAQCPMCRMSAESNLKNGGVAGKNLNTGILYMLALPYLLVGAMGFWWWKNRRRADENPSESFAADAEV